MTKENFPALVPTKVPTRSSHAGARIGADHAVCAREHHAARDPYADIKDDFTDQDYKNVEDYLTDFTANGPQAPPAEGECAESEPWRPRLLKKECDPVEDSPSRSRATTPRRRCMTSGQLD